MASNEDLKFFLASQMQSFAAILLNTLLDKRFYNDSSSAIAAAAAAAATTTTTAQWPHESESLSTAIPTVACRNELIQVSSSALKNEHWALKGKISAILITSISLLTT